MAQPNNNTQLSYAFKTFFERETLTGVDFNDWYRSLRIVLRVADTYDYLYKPCPDQPLETASEEDKAAWKAEYKKHNDAVEIYDLVDALHSCKQALGKSVSAHVLEMKDIRAIRILIAITAYYDYEIWQMDVKTAFLNGRLDEDIYMEQPEGHKEVKDCLGKCFTMKDLEEAAYILGIKIYKDTRRLIRLSQSAYIDKILKKYNMHNSKKGYLPMEVKHDLSNKLCASTPEEVAYMKKVPYASAIRSI
nr:retrotransposon protein, putative, Ty1-copia subclass [Tanacetum cinerariifolium]